MTTSGIEYTGDSNRHPLNSADGSVVRHNKRYTLTRRVATATTQITIRGIPRHGKLKTVHPQPALNEQRDQEMCDYTNIDIANTIQISHFSMSRGRRIPDAAIMETPRTIKT